MTRTTISLILVSLVTIQPLFAQAETPDDQAQHQRAKHGEVKLSSGLLQDIVETSSFLELRDRLEIGQTIYVTESSGQMIKGKISALSWDTTEITMEEVDGHAKESSLTFSQRDIRSIELETRYESGSYAWLGTALGAAGGFGLVAAGIAAGCEQPGCMGSDYPVAFGLALGAPLGALAGWVAGKSIKKHKTLRELLYTSSAREVAISFAPILSKDRRGGVVSISF